jgi:hypothetical protein
MGMRAWVAPGLREWALAFGRRALELEDAQERDEASLAVNDARAALVALRTCEQLQAFHRTHATAVYVPFEALPVQLSLGTASCVYTGLARSYEGFLSQLALAGGAPPLDAPTARRWAEAAAAVTRKLIATPTPTANGELGDRTALIDALRSEALDLSKIAVRRIVSQLRVDADAARLAAAGLLALDRACPASFETPGVGQSLRRWHTRLLRSGEATAWTQLLDAEPRLGPELPVAKLKLLVKQGANHLRIDDAGVLQLYHEVRRGAAETAAALSRIADRCARTADRVAGEFALDLGMRTSVVIAPTAAAAPPSYVRARVVQAPAHLGAFGVDGAARVYVRCDDDAPLIRLLLTAEAARAWVLRAFADVLASGALLLGGVGAEYASRVITYEYAKHEAALLRLREESPLWTRLDAPPLRAEEADS